MVVNIIPLYDWHAKKKQKKNQTTWRVVFNENRLFVTAANHTRMLLEPVLQQLRSCVVVLEPHLKVVIPFKTVPQRTLSYLDHFQDYSYSVCMI